MSSVAGLVIFPGSGSSASHSSLTAIENAVAPLPVARVDFPYRRAGKSFPDKTPVLLQCVKDEVRAFAASLGVPTSRIVIGGRSMGGRMCSMAVADDSDPLEVAGLVPISYPLHPPGKPDKLRIEHLPQVTVPTLCISGTRDAFGTPAELQAALSVVPGEVTWQFLENKRHELAKADDEIAGLINNWLP